MTDAECKRPLKQQNEMNEVIERCSDLKVGKLGNSYNILQQLRHLVCLQQGQISAVCRYKGIFQISAYPGYFGFSSLGPVAAQLALFIPLYLFLEYYLSSWVIFVGVLCLQFHHAMIEKIP